MAEALILIYVVIPTVVVLAIIFTSYKTGVYVEKRRNRRK